ncbi:MAG: hypothetical protein JJT78_05845 [Leptospira sp.]|nr:hypothetical protein [Leptospira sp.]
MKKGIYSWLLKKRVVIPLAIFLLYHIIFNSWVGQIVLEKAFSASTRNAELKANVTRFSLFFGIEIKDVSVRSLGSVSDSPILLADRIALLYSLPAILVGRVSIREIGLENTKIHLKEKNGSWNYLEILNPASEDSESTPTKTESVSEKTDSLSLPIPMSLYALLNLNDIDFRYEDNSSNKDLEVRGIKLKFILDTYRTSNIPFSITAIDLVDRIHFELNPTSLLYVRYIDQQLEIDDSLNFSFLIQKEGEGQNFSLNSNANIGGRNLSISKKGKDRFDYNLLLDYDLSYNRDSDSIWLKKLLIQFQDDVWLNGHGKIERPFSGDRTMNLSLTDSNIKLKPLSKLLEQLPMDRMVLGGVLELSPLEVSGATKNLSLDWKLKGRDLLFQKKTQKISSKYLDIDLYALLDFDTKRDPTASNPLPLLKELQVRRFRVEYNGLFANLKGIFNPGSNIDLELNLDRVQIHEFAKSVYGNLDSRLKLTGNNMSELNGDLNLNLATFRFFMDRSRSGNSHNKLVSNFKLNFNKPWGLHKASIENLNLITKNSSGGQAMQLNVQGILNIEDGKKIDLPNTKLDINFTNLVPILPLPLRESILPIEKNITKNIQVALNGFFDLNSRIYDAKISSRIPGINLNDLTGILSLDLSAPGELSSIGLRKFSLRGFSGTLGLDISGKLFQKPGAKNPPIGSYFGNLNLELFLRSDQEKDLSTGVNYRGNINLKAKIVDNILEGMLVTENVRVLISRGLCPGEDCKLYLVENLNADIPVHHDLTKKKASSLIEGDKTRFIKTYGRIPRDNLSIHRVVGTHPSISGTPFSYVTANGHRPGLTGRVQYRENYLFIDGLKVSILDGMVYGKDILLNLGTGTLKDMEFMGSIQVRDIDLKQLLSRQAQRSIDNGKIKADLNLSGRDLSDPIPNLNLYFSIYQIGRDFGKSVLNIISNKGALMNYITDSYAVDKVEVELSKGLVYADVLFKRSLLSYMVSLEDSKISQQRMPLANFLKRAESEIASYR